MFPVNIKTKKKVYIKKVFLSWVSQHCLYTVLHTRKQFC